MQNFSFNSAYLALIIVLSFSALVYSSPTSVGSPHKVDVLKEGNSSVSIQQPELIGSIEGKSYYNGLSAGAGLNWTQAKEYCNSSGLQLATITSEAQLTFLLDAYSSGILPDLWYWTGGREARQWRMFSWDQTNEELPAVFTEQGYMGSSLPNDFFMCLIFGPTYGSLYVIECKYTYYVLCEST